MKSVNYLFLFVLLTISVSITKAQTISDFNQATFFKAKYKKDKVWDVQRSPAYPIAGQDWTLSGLKGALDASGASVDWGQDRYLMLVSEIDNTNGVNSLINDVNQTGGRYGVSLKLFESNGTLVKVVSKWGKVVGIGEKGFMYEVEGRYGTFFSVAAVPASTVIKYKPTLAAVTKVSELVNASELTKSLELATGISDGPFFSAKYIKENVWDVQRSPAYPIAGQEWTLSGLKGALDASGASIDWGSGRYLMLVPEVDNTNGANSLVDDINKNGTKHNVSLKLYERNGTLVKVISKWGKVVGIGEKGFMYEVEGRYGTFFSVAVVNSSTVIKYKPTLAAVTKLSELITSSDLTKSLEIEKGSGLAKKSNATISILDNPFFMTKYIKEKVWDAQRSPSYPLAGQEWTLSGLQSAYEPSGSKIDWGVGRFVMFTCEPDISKSTKSLVDDVNNSGIKYNISLKLYESTGKFVKVVSKWGKIIGMGDKGFMYEAEGLYGTFFSASQINSSIIIRYKPNIAEVTKLSEIVKVPEVAISSGGKKPIEMNDVSDLSKTKVETLQTQIATGYYTLTARCSGKVLDVLDASQMDGATIQQWDLNGNTAQHWKIEPVAGAPGYYTLTARCSGKLLDVLNGSPLDGAKVQQWKLNGNIAQHWKIEPVAGAPGYYIFTARCSGKVLDVIDGNKSGGAYIQLWKLNGNIAQHWKLNMVN